MKKMLEIMFLLFCLACVFYFVYIAINSDDGKVAMILRVIAAIIMAFASTFGIRDFRKSNDDHVWKWYVNDEPKGMLRYLVKYGVLLVGVIVGFLTWVYLVDFQATNQLFISALKHMGSASVGGVFGAWLTWLSNKSRARELNLDQRLLEEDL